MLIFFVEEFGGETTIPPATLVQPSNSAITRLVTNKFKKHMLTKDEFLEMVKLILNENEDLSSLLPDINMPAGLGTLFIRKTDRIRSKLGMVDVNPIVEAEPVEEYDENADAIFLQSILQER